MFPSLKRGNASHQNNPKCPRVSSYFALAIQKIPLYSHMSYIVIYLLLLVLGSDTHLRNIISIQKTALLRSDLKSADWFLIVPHQPFLSSLVLLDHGSHNRDLWLQAEAWSFSMSSTGHRHSMMTSYNWENRTQSSVVFLGNQSFLDLLNLKINFIEIIMNFLSFSPLMMKVVFLSHIKLSYFKK